MNILKIYQHKIIDLLILLNKKNILIIPEKLESIVVEIPPAEQMSDLSCNASLILSKINKKKPMEIALLLKDELLKNFDEFNGIEVAKPGFLNISFKSSFWEMFINNILKQKKDYGFTNENLKIKKYNIEFVSANPTGPLHVGHCRGAILGDVLANLVSLCGHNVVKEYYINDYGNQIKNFTLSVFYRINEILKNIKFPQNKDLYPGSYIVDIANSIINEKKIKDYDNFDSIKNDLTKSSLRYSMQMIKEDLSLLGINHDVFTSETSLVENNVVLKAIEILKKKDFVYKGFIEQPKGTSKENWKPRKQLLFKSTNFGDDIDRSLQKEDETWTYFANDIAYHHNKISKGYDVLINILGSDHTGYIKRIESAVKALSNNKTLLKCKTCQLVKLIKNGQEVKMSKRSGEYITSKDLFKEVGKDVIRFIMLNRNNEVELDFDFNKVTEKTKDNPVFYVQYAYARINSIFRNLKIKIDSNISLSDEKFYLDKYAIDILKKISEWPKCVEISLNRLEPHRITYYLYELSTLFHSYWNLGDGNDEYKFVISDKPQSKSKLLLLQSFCVVIENGMKILGVSTPSKM
ncbi:MAG: arginine--tRNA ligase [Candidatus Pelagibacter sp. TMED64]|nr:arginine--tRNA ligase [Candidatus Pelagibacter sp.]OUU66078.1 MAG: arginine--tRNA ligase [Candidatus Pelagibacter sp. TMED64]